MTRDNRLKAAKSSTYVTFPPEADFILRITNRYVATDFTHILMFFWITTGKNRTMSLINAIHAAH